jgi:hypothetical protein
MKWAAALAMLALALPAWAQPRIQKPPTRTRATLTNAEDDETEVDLATLAADIGLYDHKRVRTRGVIELIANASGVFRDRMGRDPVEYYELRSRHSNAALLFIPGYGLLRDDLKQVLGSELQVRGIVRMLRARGEDIADPQSPELPPLPAQAPDLPRVSITVLSLSMSGKPRESIDGQNFARQVLADPSKFAGKPIRILGQFRGNNLFGDLTEDTRRKAADWVLKDGAIALWVTERPPKGKGFALDPAYKGDTSRWLEVEGKPEVVNGVLYLRATQVFLAQRRQEPER